MKKTEVGRRKAESGAGHRVHSSDSPPGRGQGWVIEGTGYKAGGMGLRAWCEGYV